MPELPDVETFRHYVNSRALRQTIDHVRVYAPRLLSDASAQAIGRALGHRRFERTRRHGKYLFLAVDHARWLVLHFGMTGRLVYFRTPTDRPRHTQFLISFTNRCRLAYVAPRKLGGIALADNPQAFVRRRHLGPDALALDWNGFGVALRKWRGGIKGWLMNQQAVAGIGNIYSDEILFHARIAPQRKAVTLARPEVKRLFGKMRYVLNCAIRGHADPAHMSRSWLIHHRHEGGHCPRCRHLVRRSRIAGRTAWYCSRCQR